MSSPILVKLLRKSEILRSGPFFSSRAFSIFTNSSNNFIFPPSAKSLKRTYTNTTGGDNDIIIEQLTEGEKYLYEKLSNKFNPTKLHVQDISGIFIHASRYLRFYLIFYFIIIPIIDIYIN